MHGYTLVQRQTALPPGEEEGVYRKISRPLELGLGSQDAYMECEAYKVIFTSPFLILAILCKL